MTRIIYARARSDYEHLESFAELTDQVELDAKREWLMRNPTATAATKLYRSAVLLWFREHQNKFNGQGCVDEIKERHGIK